ncbi:hypothetical protein ICM05_09695 [Leucobacter sp. cx-42]|uniref:hypothetical protein n=1 Tax=unclassified Leucobacter TaxID=2621730 RepID=UPI00165E072B|nr:MULTISPECIES: hypothetical protein [unclassified Leucobacter]MBC9954910.1 hypothetical protein [Leucobacter sp. cx-42]
MATAVKKARRASGIKFTKPTKVGTPLAERHEFRETVIKPDGLRGARGKVARSEKKLKRVREAWGVTA